jgi:hypothetical protein
MAEVTAANEKRVMTARNMRQPPDRFKATEEYRPTGVEAPYRISTMHWALGGRAIYEGNPR